MEDMIVEVLGGGGLPRQEIWRRLGLAGGKPTDEYWTAEQSLVDRGRVERRRGRSGGIFLIEEPTDTASALEPRSEAVETEEVREQVEEARRESSHYEPALTTMITHWREQQPGIKEVFGVITAGQGRRRTGGRWTRPDIVIFTISDWIFSSRPEGEVRTFEIKPFKSLDALAVYEALSHRARSHYSYLLIVDYPREGDHSDQMDSILAIAARHGIGVITAEETSNWETWVFELDARRSDADSLSINQFILDQVPADVRESFREALRRVVIRF